MKRFIISIVCCMAATTALVAQNKHKKSKVVKEISTVKNDKIKETDEDIIRKMLGAQVKEWNKGNIEGYMSGYWDNDSMLFIGAKGPKYGYQKTLERYKEAYPDKEHMGKLVSTITKMEQLSKEYYFVVGRWELKRKVGDIDGSYTLLLKKIGGNWVIVCDHSS